LGWFVPRLVAWAWPAVDCFDLTRQGLDEGAAWGAAERVDWEYCHCIRLPVAQVDSFDVGAESGHHGVVMGCMRL